MATGIVPYEKKERIYTAKCLKCGCMYIPEKKNDMLLPDGTIAYFEPCPECGYQCNGKASIIPQWKYKFIRFYRALRRTSTKPPETPAEYDCVVKLSDVDLHDCDYYWQRLKREIDGALNGKLMPYVIVRSDERAIKRHEVVKRSSDD